MEQFTGYFERQVAAECGKHAVNNLVGHPLFMAEDLKEACGRYLAEAAMADGLQDGENENWHVAASGWYSSEVLSFALRNTHLFFGEDAPSYELELASLRQQEHIFHNDEVIGALQNQDNHHWIAIRKEGGQAWLLDSRRVPRPLTPKQLSESFVRYPNTFAVRRHYVEPDDIEPYVELMALGEEVFNLPDDSDVVQVHDEDDGAACRSDDSGMGHMHGAR